MTPRQQLENIITSMEAFKQGCVVMINQASFRIREDLKIKNIDKIIESLSKKIEALCELQLRNEFNEDGKMNYPENVNKIIGCMLMKIKELLKLQFEEIIKTQSEQNKK